MMLTEQRKELSVSKCKMVHTVNSHVCENGGF